MMTADLAVGIVGTGIMGARHAKTFSDNPNTDLVAVCDLDFEQANKVADAEGCTAYASAEEMVESESLDVVLIATPDPYHRAPLITVLDSGIKNILLEKPFATSLEDAQAMYDAADAAGATVFVTYHSRAAAEHGASKYIIDSGLLGQPNYASLRSVDNISVPRMMWADRPDNWASKSSSVPFLYSHRIDRLHWFFEPAEVETVSAISRSRVLGYSADFFESFLSWGNGMVTRLHTGWVDFGSHLVYGESLFQGTAGMITHNEQAGYGRPVPGWQVVFDDIDISTLRKAQDELIDGGIYTRLIWEKPSGNSLPATVGGLETMPGHAPKSIINFVIAAILEDTLCPESWRQFQGASPLPTARDGLAQTRVCCAVEEAAATGTTVELSRETI